MKRPPLTYTTNSLEKATGKPDEVGKDCLVPRRLTFNTMTKKTDEENSR